MTVKTIELEDGKYTVSHDNGSDFHALRHGEKWRDLTGDGLALAMVHKIEDCQEQAQRNLNRAIDAETELRKAEKCDKCERHTLGIEAGGKWCTFCGNKL